MGNDGQKLLQSMFDVYPYHGQLVTDGLMKNRCNWKLDHDNLMCHIIVLLEI